MLAQAEARPDGEPRVPVAFRAQGGEVSMDPYNAARQARATLEELSPAAPSGAA